MRYPFVRFHLGVPAVTRLNDVFNPFPLSTHDLQGICCMLVCLFILAYGIRWEVR